MPRADSYPSSSALDNDDTLLSLVDGLVKNVPLPASRGYIDASHYSDLNDLVLNAGTSITGWAATSVADAGVVQLAGTVPEAVKAKIFVAHNTRGSFYVNLPADQAVGNYVEVAFELQVNTGTGGNFDSPGSYVAAFVASGVDRSGTVVYTEPHTFYADQLLSDKNNDMVHQLPGVSTTVFSTIRIPLYGLTNVRSIGVVQNTHPPTPQSSTRYFFLMRNVRFREATGFDRAVYGAAAGSHIVIPTGYTTAKTQVSVFREQANITWEDRRA